MKLHIQVVTPEKTILDTDASELTAPTTEGEITILPNHVPLLAQLAPGELVIRENGKTDHLVVVGGFLEVTGSTIRVLADYAVSGKDISAVKAQEAKERAEKKLKEKLSQQDIIIAEAELRKALLELKVARKIKH